MMARSGGFNVPADYFKQPSVIVPATPPSQQQPKKWPRYVAIAGIAAVVPLAAILVTNAITTGTPAQKGSASPAQRRGPSRRAHGGGPRGPRAREENEARRPAGDPGDGRRLARRRGHREGPLLEGREQHQGRLLDDRGGGGQARERRDRRPRAT